MSFFAIGDIQGCLPSLQELMRLLPDDNRPIWCVGDLVNRGPQSLETLRFIRAQPERFFAVLGNHDLHLLALAASARGPHRSDTIQEVLDAPDGLALIDWLRHRPLAHWQDGHLLVHAGVLPGWDVEQALRLAREVETVLRGPEWRHFMHHMYGNTPARWDDALTGMDRLRCIVNAFTRMRFCSDAGEMEFETKEGEGSGPAGYRPWFEVPGRKTEDITVVCGHWSTLGLITRPNLIGLDTGCIWGGKLSAMALPERQLYQLDCPSYRTPSKPR